jgi:HD-like signal output (HDOD) protein
VRDRIQKVLRQVNDLPTLPIIYKRVSDLMRNPKTSAAEIAAVISQDQVITVKLLRLVNSVHYGFQEKIETVTRAVSLVGMRSLRDLILATSVMDLFKEGRHLASFDVNEFWKHSLGAASAAQSIARLRGLEGEEEYFVGGLIHDIGKIVLLEHFPQEMDQILGEVKASGLQMIEVENKLLGVNHARIGRMLCKHWNLPGRYLEAVAWHHDPRCADGHGDFVAAVHVANSIACGLRLGEDGNTRIPPILPQAWEMTGLPLAEMDELVTRTAESYEEALLVLSGWNEQTRERVSGELASL